jgi:hypothetical protein
MEGIVTKDTFSKAYPDLFAEIVKDSEASGYLKGLEAGKIEGIKLGAETERARIQAVQSQLLPGHEALIEKIKFDGKTTGPEAAVQILGAERALLEGKKKELIDGSINPIAQNNVSAQKKEGDGIDPNLPIEEQAKLSWNKSPDLRKEFGDSFDAYLAFRKMDAEGRIRIFSRKMSKE